jgi:hypothetical protein
VADRYVAFAYSDFDQVDAFVKQIVAQKPNVRRTELSEEDRMEFEVVGKLGEVAFSRHFGWPVDWVVRSGGDDWDFELSNGETVDVKSVPVKKNMDYDFGIPIGDGESPATYYVQVLVSPDHEYGVITGVISHKRFEVIAREEDSWGHRGSVKPNVVNRSQLSQSWPEFFYRPMSVECDEKMHAQYVLF